MSDALETHLVQVRADTRAFARDVSDMRAALEGPLSAGAERAGQTIEGSLLRAVRTGKLGFEDLKRAALAMLSEIAVGALKAGLASVFGRGAGNNGGGEIANLLGGLLRGGFPGRATGGPVGPDRPYLVGERGPELFLPTAAGRIERADGGGGRAVNVAIRVQADAGTAPTALARSSRQVARAVRAALEEQG